MKVLNLIVGILIGFVASHPLWAGMEKFMSVEGVVSEFNSKQVKLYVDGKTLTVPRESVPPYYTVRPGNRVIAYISSDPLRKELAKSKKK